jgi:hypothetical protein
MIGRGLDLCGVESFETDSHLDYPIPRPTTRHTPHSHILETIWSAVCTVLVVISQQLGFRVSAPGTFDEKRGGE